MTRAELAEHMGVSINHVDYLRSLGAPRVMVGPRRAKYDLAEIEAWLARRVDRRRANSGSFRPGIVPWNKGTRGVMRPNAGTFGGPINPGGKTLAPLGARRWYGGRSNEVFVKVSMSPNPAHASQRGTRSGWWRPQRVAEWEAVHGPVPRGGIVRRLLPLCDCENNLVLIDRHVNALLNSGRWTRPARPWRTLPLDAGLRLTAVLAAVVAAAGASPRHSRPAGQSGGLP